MKKTTKKAPRAATPSSALTKSKQAKAPAKKNTAAPAEPPATFISAKIDIGFGNALFLRGAAPGLNWETGAPMECVAADLWTFAVKGATAPIVFKFLVNDLTWSTGEDYVIAPGQSVTLTPAF